MATLMATFFWWDDPPYGPQVPMPRNTTTIPCPPPPSAEPAPAPAPPPEDPMCPRCQRMKMHMSKKHGGYFCCLCANVLTTP